MKRYSHTWALVLAAGDGRRLSDLTADPAGGAVPKQYCSLRGGASLLQATLQRAGQFAVREHISVIVSAQHHRWWRDAGLDLAPRNLVIQPANRGTGNGVLLQLLRVLEQDPDATVVLLPSDHHVREESVLAASIAEALALVEESPERITVLGMPPDCADPELGYIVPGGADGRGAVMVAGFIEKPAPARARQLVADGALWNAFIIVCRADALLALYEERLPLTVLDMRRALRAAPRRGRALEALYELLPNIDFSRQLLASGSTARLRLVRVPACGWTDLGTPERVGVALSEDAAPPAALGQTPGRPAPVNLAARFARREPRAG